MAHLSTWHTEGRRQPSVVGKDLSGKHIPGGPYTGPQVGIGSAVVFVLWITHSLWGGLIGLNGLVQASIILGAGYYALRLGEGIDYTHTGRLWDALCGVREAVRGLLTASPQMFSAPRGAIDLEPTTYGHTTHTIPTACTILTTGATAAAEPGAPIPEPGEVAAASVPLVEQIAQAVAAEPGERSGQNGRDAVLEPAPARQSRRQPKKPRPLRGEGEAVVLDELLDDRQAAPAAGASRAPEPVSSIPSPTTPGPASALESFLAAVGALSSPGASR